MKSVTSEKGSKKSAFSHPADIKKDMKVEKPIALKNESEVASEVSKDFPDSETSKMTSDLKNLKEFVKDKAKKLFEKYKKQIEYNDDLKNNKEKIKVSWVIRSHGCLE